MQCTESPSILPVNDGWLFSIVDRPNASGRFPAVVMLHGFTGNHIEANRLYVDIARALCGAGFVVVRFDYRNHGDSSGLFEDFDIENAVNDAEYMVNYTLKLGYVDSSRLALIGLSMGGHIALRIYSRMPNIVKAVILLSPGISFRGIGKLLEQARGDYVYFGAFRLRVSNVTKMANSDAMSVADLINVPVMIIHAKDDEAVPYQQSVEFHNRVKYNDKTLVLLDKGGHVFSDYEIKSKVIEAIVNWLREKLRVS
ncbi:alpha/beta hydrolase family protein [Caldivirga maquilingensis]|uniref:Dienelactone hydrolase n=1 Tax=Caldivirga maquilingensis (strain ATCC 700844 / DSM 13496 / JCM 10307 / IC-167) TaxID=397948 RepID=A8MDX1_CALMQ|nr:alpha/beta fold hydrolase [Caldivirga maquilingensis]ABW01977.1 dienelactone hydrolase [Caldivirga maquilingensis IC-167]